MKKSKVFISFLGTNNYVECNYRSSESMVTKNIKYVQEATIKHFCRDFDSFVFFLTEDAEKINWTGETGLKSRLEAIDSIKNKIVSKRIPNVFKIEEIWQIFQIMYDEIREKDQLVFDITHAFRSLPMLGMVLISYLKAVKKVEIKGIYYGAFEARGTRASIEKLPIEKRNVDILDLLGFSLLQDWTVAANNFYDFGNVEKLSEIISKEIKPVLANTKGQDSHANMLRSFINPLPTIFENITAVRLIEICKSEQYNNVRDAISEIKTENMPQLIPLLNKIQEKLQAFKTEDSIINGFHAVKLCIDYGWVQQAYTLLIETTVSYILDKEGLDWKTQKFRNILNSCFSFLQKNTKEETWTGDAAKYKEITKKLLESKLVATFKDDFNELNDSRNDINHAGIRNNAMSADKLKEKIEKIYCNIISKIL